jgi:hypothetical protein
MRAIGCGNPKRIFPLARHTADNPPATSIPGRWVVSHESAPRPRFRPDRQTRIESPPPDPPPSEEQRWKRERLRRRSDPPPDDEDIYGEQPTFRHLSEMSQGNGGKLGTSKSTHCM